ncbi:DNA mismatch repair protein MutS [Stappia sp. GBMRC 2046]|uniref:DNA mismatch repair protein MutS n=1 Tax=Stappia sediminis TaxID=2692190 RepID=A0A7X3LTF4_9HYPH|nr:Smr/MutS family protein [Stappia sediminis]MXN64761.1 DNA mismatch repair protein MutS [Stappia sediminis]
MNGKSRRGRQLSPEERALWEQVARSAKPLHPPKPKPGQPGAGDGALAQKAERNEPPAPATSTAIRSPQAKPTVPPTIKPPALAPLERRHRQKLARGKAGVDARIDLHGLTQAEAHSRLAGFLRLAQAKGHTLVLVITGKGSPERGAYAHERGVLRRVVPQWLAMPEFRSVVVGFEEAQRTHGGGGALYVRIRKKRGAVAR